MTNEVAIKILQKLYEGCNKHKNTDLIKEAYNMAIEALKAQDATDTNVGSNGDTIYRQMAIDALMEILDRPNHAEFLYTDEICRALGQLPSVQPEIVRCKDCKYSHDEYGDGDCYCKRPGKGCDWLGQRWDFYCADAERKTDEPD